MTSKAVSILLITANNQISSAVTDLLQNEPTFVLQKTVTLAEMVDQLPVKSPDLILLDMALSEGDDNALITAVTSHFPQLPIVAIVENAIQVELPAVQEVVSPDDLQNLLLLRVLYNQVILSQQVANKSVERQQQELAESLRAVGVQLNASLDFDYLLDYILEQIEGFLPYDVAAIQLIEGDYSRLVRLRVSDHAPPLDWITQKASTLTYNINETTNIQTIMDTRQPLAIPDVGEYPGWFHFTGESHIRSWIGAPMIVQDSIIGFVSLDKVQTNYYKQEHISILAAFADQAAAALHNSRIHKENRRQIEELRVLHAIANASSKAVDVDELLTHCTEIIAERLYPDSFGFILTNGDGTMSAHPSVHNRLSVIHPEKLPVDTGVVGRVIQTGEVKRISNIYKDDDYQAIVAHTHSELCVPLRVGGEIIGAINAESILYDAFTEADERFLITLSQQLTTAIERIQLLEAERAHHEEMAVLREATLSLTASLDLEQVLTTILNRLAEVVPYEGATIFLLQGDKLLIAASHGLKSASDMVGKTFPANDYLFSEVQHTKRPLCLQDAQQNQHFNNWDDTFVVHSWICIPLIVREQISGVLTIDHSEISMYGDVETNLAQDFANQAAIAIENARLYKAEQQARKMAEMMREANTVLLQSLNLDTILKSLIEYMQLLLPFDNLNFWFIQGDFAQIYFPETSNVKLPEETVADLRVNIRINTLFEEILTSQQSMLITDVKQDSRWPAFAVKNPSTVPTGSWMGIPIIAGGKPIGFITLDKAARNFFTDEHLYLAENFTAQAAILIQNAQLLQETHQRTVELEAITSLSASLRETAELDPLLSIILEKLLQLVDGAFGGIYLIEEGTKELVLRGTLPSKPELVGLRQPIDDGVSGYVARTGRIYIMPDFRKDPLLKLMPEEVPLFHQMRTGITLPLRTQERIVGVLYVGLDRTHSFTDMEVQLLTAVSEIAGTAIDRAMMMDTLEQRVTMRTRELAKANERLTELDRLKTKFVSDISHELRTPTTNLSLYLDLLEQGKPERREQYYAILRRQVNRLITMIEDILNISRLDMGKLKLNLSPLSINTIVQQVVIDFENQLSENITLTKEIHDDIPLILGDEKQITLILDNLFQNAVNYTHAGSIRIATMWEDIDNRVRIELQDTGIGIPPRELDHILERFYRASNVSQSTMAGTGLGLSLVKELVELHHGEIEITSELDVGTSITLYLPVVPNLPVA